MPDGATPVEDLQRAALAGLQRRVVKPPQKLIPCPFCQDGIAFSKFSYLWGHSCWICAGWGAIWNGRMLLRGPIAPHPGRQFR